MTWAQAVAGPLAGATCLWQDLDGLHMEPAPQAAPPTSILWGWREDSLLVRMRLDGNIAFVAIHQPGASTAVATVPWDAHPGGDERVAALRGPAAETVRSGAVCEQVIVESDGDGTGPVTFIRQVTGPGTARDVDA